jgi:hypothetical protein
MRRRVEIRAQLREGERLHGAQLEETHRAADYPSFETFYSANVARRGDDVRLRDLRDGELLWAIVWLPRTTEVAAFAKGWADPTWHRRLATNGETGASAMSTWQPPQLVFVLGQASSAAEAKSCIKSSTSLGAMRASLVDMP